MTLNSKNRNKAPAAYVVNITPEARAVLDRLNTKTKKENGGFFRLDIKNAVSNLIIKHMGGANVD